MSDPVPWREAWHAALYGPDGFYRRPGGPGAHFTTATHGATGAVLADALWTWADRLGADGIVDVGAGRGELLAHLYAAAPGRPLSGLDVVGRPAGLPDAVGWDVSPGGGGLPSRPVSRAQGGPRTLAVAHEWLDVVPCPVGQVAADGSLRTVLVDPTTGAETLGGPLDDADLEWCRRHWPSVVGSGAVAGDRVEVGRERDVAWSRLLDRQEGGPAVAVDYGHTFAVRPPGGTLSAYRSGEQVEPVPDGSCDLTAHVAVDALHRSRLLRQRDALGPVAGPDHDLARRDPAAYLAAIGRRSAAAALRAPGGFGDFWWVVWDG